MIVDLKISMKINSKLRRPMPIKHLTFLVKSQKLTTQGEQNG